MQRGSWTAQGVAILLPLVFRNYMNDSLRTDVFVRFQPESIACACIYLAARTLEVSVPLSRVPA